MKLLLIMALSVGQVFAQATTNPDLPAPETLTRKYLEELSKRELGQSQFVVKNRDWQEEQQQEQQQEEGDREIQEADIYKIGHKGQKELFLLNNYRGFQVISFKEGLEKPKLIGRLPVYNNWSSEMYFLEAQNRVLILNTEWTYSYNHWSTNYTTKIYVIDVANPEQPKIVSEENVPGYLENSRLVGDVLYTITNNGDWSNTKAMITSHKMYSDELKQVDTEELNSDGRWVRTMNVVQKAEKYYVISTLSNWSGGDRVNVHDITSAKGEIKKVMTAKARGSISERSQTFIHKDYLFAVSNYNSAGNLARVSVEAFPVKDGAAIVESAENMRFSIGDTNGQHASLQDVRVSGDLLYAFWVPANNIDPFELFDISEPSKGFKHLGQLQFDGWISKAFPIDYNNRKFVLGLGWIIPATSESGQRYPQAKLFEIKNVGGVLKHEVISSMTIDSERFWASMNGEDKYFEIIQDKPGVFNIMFPVTYMKDWKSGAKIINADLNTLALTEGASVVGEQGWLRRIFINKEVQGLHTFDDLRLESYDQTQLGNPGIAKTVSVLELARNIVDFHVVSGTEGFQVVALNKEIELRRVSLANTDAEKDETTVAVTISGKYSWHKIKNNTLYAVTTFYKKKPQTETEEDEDDYSSNFDYANFNVVNLTTGEKTAQKIDLTGVDTSEYFWFHVENISSAKTEVFNISGKSFILNGNSLSKLSVEESCQYFFKDEGRNFSFITMNGELYAYNAFDVKPVGPTTSEEDEYVYSFPFYKKLDFNGQSITCSPSTNAPGKPLYRTESRDGGHHVLTTEGFDHYYDDYGCGGEEKGIKFSFYPQDNNSSKTYSLKVAATGELVLVDVLNKDISGGVTEGGFVTFTAQESRIDLWSITNDGLFNSRPQYLDYNDSKNVSLVTVKKLGARNFLFMKDKTLVDVYEIAGNTRLKKLSVTSTYDKDPTDDSAENIYEMETIRTSADGSRFFISQGNYGMSDIILK